MFLVQEFKLRFEAFDVFLFAFAEGALGGAVLGAAALEWGLVR